MASFAKAGATLQGTTPLAQLERLGTGTVAPADGEDGVVQWSAQGELQQSMRGAAQVRLHLQAQATVRLECQRCLQPAAYHLDIDRRFRFVRDEDEAARLDEESEDDVLALPRVLDLESLIEDELILTLPIVPRHENCPNPLPMVDASENEDAGAPSSAQRGNPFAALAALKTRR
jgi:uncharacterized protein